MKIAANLFAALFAALAGLLLAPPGAWAQSRNPDGALEAYRNAVSRFEQVLRQRRTQLDAHQPLPNLPGQPLYLARNDMISTYKDLTDTVPSRIGKPNKFGIPPAYFEAANEPLLQ